MGSVGALVIAYPKDTAPLAPKPAAAGAGEPEPKRALARAAGIPELVRNISSFTQRSEARELIDAAPNTLIDLDEEGDLDRIINGTAVKMSPGHYLLESGSMFRESKSRTGFTRRSVFATGDVPKHILLPAGPEGIPDKLSLFAEPLEEELKAVNKALGIKLGSFILKTTNKKPIEAVGKVRPGEVRAGERRFLFYFGYEGEVSDKDKDLLREIKKLLPSRGKPAAERMEAKFVKAEEDRERRAGEWHKKVKELEDEIVKSMIGGTPKDRRALARRHRASSVKVGEKPETFKAIDNMPIRRIAHEIARNELRHLLQG
jgi:hypothetical protein